MKKNILPSLILAVGICILGLFVYLGIRQFTAQNRFVSVRGLSEREVMADRVIWPISFKEVDNDLSHLYTTVQTKNKIIIDFLKQEGIQEEEISIAPPILYDLDAERYVDRSNKYRFNITSVITVTTSNIEVAQKAMRKQSDLLRKNIAISTDEYKYPVSYEYTQLNSIKPVMIEEATKNAREVAEKFAKDSQSKLGKIKRANQGLFSIADRDPNTPHIKKIRVVTSVDYFLKK